MLLWMMEIHILPKKAGAMSGGGGSTTGLHKIFALPRCDLLEDVVSPKTDNQRVPILQLSFF